MCFRISDSHVEDLGFGMKNVDLDLAGRELGAFDLRLDHTGNSFTLCLLVLVKGLVVAVGVL